MDNGCCFEQDISIHEKIKVFLKDIKCSNNIEIIDKCIVGTNRAGNFQLFNELNYTIYKKATQIK